jgi:hypothetical protein
VPLAPGDSTPKGPPNAPGLLAIDAQESNSRKPQPAALIHSVTAAQLPTLVNHTPRPHSLRTVSATVSPRIWLSPSPSHSSHTGRCAGRCVVRALFVHRRPLLSRAGGDPPPQRGALAKERSQPGGSRGRAAAGAGGWRGRRRHAVRAEPRVIHGARSGDGGGGDERSQRVATAAPSAVCPPRSAQGGQGKPSPTSSHLGPTDELTCSAGRPTPESHCRVSDVVPASRRRRRRRRRRRQWCPPVRTRLRFASGHSRASSSRARRHVRTTLPLPQVSLSPSLSVETSVGVDGWV